MTARPDLLLDRPARANDEDLWTLYPMFYVP
jgi:hypothetical protein